jgi:hypothetical protein
VALTILMIAMLFTAVSYGRMATTYSGALRASQGRLINVVSSGLGVLCACFVPES